MRLNADRRPGHPECHARERSSQPQNNSTTHAELTKGNQTRVEGTIKLTDPSLVPWKYDMMIVSQVEITSHFHDDQCPMHLPFLT